MDFSALSNAASTLESEIKTLERSADSLESWRNLWIALVVIGVVIELLVLMWEYRHDRTDWKRGTIRSPEKPSLLLFMTGLLGAGLVATGVGGELGVTFKAQAIQSKLRNKQNERAALLQQIAAI